VSVADDRSGPIDEDSWAELVPRTGVLPDTRHRFPVEVPQRATHLRLDIYPDGGLARLRCWGEVPDDVRDELLRRYQDSLPGQHQKFPRP
jgi:allantoicase